MEITIAGQTWTFLGGILLGAVLGICYDLFRVARIIISHPPALVAVEDIGDVSVSVRSGLRRDPAVCFGGRTGWFFSLPLYFGCSRRSAGPGNIKYPEEDFFPSVAPAFGACAAPCRLDHPTGVKSGEKPGKLCKISREKFPIPLAKALQFIV